MLLGYWNLLQINAMLIPKLVLEIETIGGRINWGIILSIIQGSFGFVTAFDPFRVQGTPQIEGIV